MEKSEIVEPKNGGELYRGLLEIWGNENVLDIGLAEAKEHLLDCIKGRLNYPHYLSTHYDRNIGYVDSLTFMWVLLKIQLQGNNITEILQELESAINSAVNPFDGATYLDYESKAEHIRFLRCKDLISRLSSQNLIVSQAPVVNVKKTMGVNISPMVSESIEKAMSRMQEIVESAKHLESQLIEKDALLKAHVDSLKESENKYKRFENENKELKKKIDSEEFRDEVGREYIKKVFEEYLKDADEMEQSLRKDWFNVLQGLCSIEGVPKEVKKMIQSLKRKPKGGDSMTVNTQTYVETQNNNYK